jgi:F0F1-type ATP synthase membrane subunit b/b'
MHELIFPTVNLAILIVLLAIYTKAPIRQFVSDRHRTLRDELQSVRELLVRAQSQYDEFTSKLKAMDAEIESLRSQAKQDASAMRSRVTAETQRLSATIVSDARASAQGLYAQLKAELFAEVGGKIVDRAEGLMRDRLTGDDRARIRQEFSSQLERAQ